MAKANRTDSKPSRPDRPFVINSVVKRTADRLKAVKANSTAYEPVDCAALLNLIQQAQNLYNSACPILRKRK